MLLGDVATHAEWPMSRKLFDPIGSVVGATLAAVTTEGSRSVERTLPSIQRYTHSNEPTETQFNQFIRLDILTSLWHTLVSQ